jgi:hypothetical protein
MILYIKNEGDRVMEIKYYVQEYARKRVESILPVPNNYHLRGDFGSKFISDFSALTELLKEIYMDVIKSPCSYKCDLYPLDQEPRGKGTDNESNNSLDRIVKCLKTLCDCGEIKGNTLKIDGREFKKQIKRIKNYSTIIEKLKDFGFCFPENIFDKNTENFFVQNTNKPDIINTIKIYMNCWNEVLNDEYLKHEIKKNGYGCIAYYYDFFLFDYKVTANPQELNELQSVQDDCYIWDSERKNVYIKFYEISKEYPTIHFAKGNYFIGKKRICTFRYDNSQRFLKMKLKNPGKYITVIEKLPEYLQECFSKKAIQCSRCGCLGNNPDTCNNKIHWNFKGNDYIGCSMDSFYFNDIKVKDIQYLFTLLEYDYNIEKK